MRPTEPNMERITQRHSVEGALWSYRESVRKRRRPTWKPLAMAAERMKNYEQMNRTKTGVGQIKIPTKFGSFIVCANG